MGPRKARTKRDTGTGRLYIFAVSLIVVTGLVTYQLFRLTFVQHNAYVKAAQAQQAFPGLRLAGRGTMYGFDQSTKENKLLAGIKKDGTGARRTYPQGSLAAQVLGFVGYSGNDRVGQYGVESYYDDVLNSTLGDDIVLTIDPTIQSYVEAKLAEVLRKYASPRGSAIVQDPVSGAILAMASSPSFDPNHYQDFPVSHYLNPAVQEEYEPGSTMKAVTMAGALNAGAVTPDTTYTDTGLLEINGYPIRNYNNGSNGVQTMRQVLDKSLNTGAVFAEGRLGNDKFLNNIVGFGFGQKTGIDLAGETDGNISNLYQPQQVNFATAAFGQGVAVTSLQLINAYSTIANGGKLMRPYVVREIVHGDGSVTPTKTKILGTPITERTASTLTSMLVDVVDNGFDKGQVAGYDVAGKTGTAQIPDRVRGGYLIEDQFIHDFVGFAPAYAPRFTVLLKMERPRGIKFASRSLSPVFADIAGFLLRYFKVPPTRR